MLLLPAALFVPLWFVRAGQTRRAQWIAWIPVALTISHYLVVTWVGRVGLLGLGTTAWLVGTTIAMLVVLRRSTSAKEAAEIYAFRVRAKDGTAVDRLQVDDRAVARLRTGTLVPDLVHHERNGQGRLADGGAELAGR
jgi:hypothetical protein